MSPWWFFHVDSSRHGTWKRWSASRREGWSTGRGEYKGRDMPGRVDSPRRRPRVHWQICQRAKSLLDMHPSFGPSAMQGWAEVRVCVTYVVRQLSFSPRSREIFRASSIHPRDTVKFFNESPPFIPLRFPFKVVLSIDHLERDIVSPIVRFMRGTFNCESVNDK